MCSVRVTIEAWHCSDGRRGAVPSWAQISGEKRRWVLLHQTLEVLQVRCHMTREGARSVKSMRNISNVLWAKWQREERPQDFGTKTVDGKTPWRNNTLLHCQGVQVQLFPGASLRWQYRWCFEAMTDAQVVLCRLCRLCHLDAMKGTCGAATNAPEHRGLFTQGAIWYFLLLEISNRFILTGPWNIKNQRQLSNSPDILSPKLVSLHVDLHVSFRVSWSGSWVSLLSAAACLPSLPPSSPFLYLNDTLPSLQNFTFILSIELNVSRCFGYELPKGARIWSLCWCTSNYNHSCNPENSVEHLVDNLSCLEVVLKLSSFFVFVRFQRQDELVSLAVAAARHPARVSGTKD